MEEPAKPELGEIIQDRRTPLSNTAFRPALDLASQFAALDLQFLHS